MKRFLLAPDSFKGTLTDQQVCEIEAEVIRRHIPDAQILMIPMADGGEGVVDAYLNLNGGTKLTVPVTGLLGDVVQADLVITGEGCSDWQSANGKVPGVVAATARRLRYPVFSCAELWGRGLRHFMNAVPRRCSVRSTAVRTLKRFGRRRPGTWKR